MTSVLNAAMIAAAASTIAALARRAVRARKEAVREAACAERVALLRGQIIGLRAHLAADSKGEEIID